MDGSDNLDPQLELIPAHMSCASFGHDGDGEFMNTLTRSDASFGPICRVRPNTHFEQARSGPRRKYFSFDVFFMSNSGKRGKTCQTPENVKGSKNAYTVFRGVEAVTPVQGVEAVILD